MLKIECGCKSDSICGECRAQMLAARDAVADGGVYYRCLECGDTGYVPAACEYAGMTRAQVRLPAPLPCLLEFDTCAEHADPELVRVPAPWRPKES